MKTELWRIGIVRADVSQIALGAGSIDPGTITWLPAQRPFAFIADPFALWEGGKLHVLAEHFDYRTKHGVIQYYTFNADLALEAHGEALRAPFHLSYPFLVRHEGEIYMTPEGHRSGRLTLYRARRFPDQWEPMCEILDEPAVDPTLVYHDGLWWMFYSYARTRRTSVDELHVAFAEKITGPWRSHPANPVRTAADSARPGGTPFMSAGALHIATQDSCNSYGEAVTVLRVDALTPDSARFEIVNRIAPETLGLEGFEGLHTLAGAEGVTLFDVKTVNRSPGRVAINLQRRLHRLRRGAHR